MDRREALKTTSYVLGYSLTGMAGMSFYSCNNKAEEEISEVANAQNTNQELQFLTREQFDLVADVAETFLPETDTPGARSAGVPGFIDDELKHMVAVPDQLIFMRGLQEVESISQSRFDKPFGQCTQDEKNQVIASLETIAADKEENEERDSFYIRMKQMTYRGYYTSEIICKNVLQYNPVPTQFHGCIDVEPGARAWAL